MKKVIALIIAFCGICAAAANSKASASAELAADFPKESCVRIITGKFDGQRRFQKAAVNSGVIISPDGLILTTHQAVLQNGKPADEIWAGVINPKQISLSPNRAFKLNLLAVNDKKDLAVLEIETDSPNYKFPFARLAAAEQVFFGENLQAVGFAKAAGFSVSATAVSVLNLNETEGWLQVEGSLLNGLNGSPLINQKGVLVGLLTKTETNKTVPFFNGGGDVVGEVVIESVGIIETADSIMEFLREVKNLTGIVLPNPTVPPVLVSGAVTDKLTKRPIQNAAIGLLVRNAEMPEFYISRNELLAYARTDGSGAFRLNRRIPAGKYVVKLVHPSFKTVIREVNLPADAVNLQIEMDSERKLIVSPVVRN